MTLRGHIKNGAVVLEQPVQLPDGTPVEVNVPVAEPVAESQPRTLYETLEPVIGKAVGLPSDSSINHDHYLYGVPKRR